VTAPLARLAGITRRFGRTTALAGADLSVRAGEVHALLGENGAGKSTLLGVLGGLLRPDSGTVEIDGRAVEMRTPREAWARGIGLVHQHFALVPGLSVVDNLALGVRVPGRRFSRADAWVRAEVASLEERTGLSLPLDAPVEDLGVGTRQRVELARALLRRPRVLALDEPTAVLTPTEVDALFGLLRELAQAGTAVVLVAHKLDEVLGVAEHVTVLRAGRTILSAPRSAVDAVGLTRAMVGRDVADAAAVGRADLVGGRSAGTATGPVVAALDGVHVVDGDGRVALRGVSLGVRRREVVGVAGVEGNGQRELALVLAGRRAPTSGRAALPAGVGFIPEDRRSEGLVADFDLAANLALALHDAPAYRSGPLLRWGRVRERATELMGRYDVRASGPGARAGTLSGGNQQRLVVAREIAVAVDLLVAENPTRGLDVAATSFVHAEIGRLTRREGGPGVVLVSTDLDEVLALADRVVVMVRGRLLDVPEAARTREGVGALMLAGSAD
jgi:general nucleoside transport system ATP-binding protein